MSNETNHTETTMETWTKARQIRAMADAAVIVAVAAACAAVFAMAGGSMVTVTGHSGDAAYRLEMRRSDVNMPEAGVCVVDRGDDVVVLYDCEVRP